MENANKCIQPTGMKPLRSDGTVDYQNLSEEVFNQVIVPYVKFKNELNLKLKLLQYHYVEYPKFHNKLKYQILSSPLTLDSNFLDTILTTELCNMGIYLYNF